MECIKLELFAQPLYSGSHHTSSHSDIERCGLAWFVRDCGKPITSNNIGSAKEARRPPSALDCEAPTVDTINSQLLCEGSAQQRSSRRHSLMMTR